MVELLARPGVDSVVGHVRRFGVRALVGAARNEGGLVRKPTRWASSAPELLRRGAARGAGSRGS
eukprot:3993513-Alexandrium_andersonii.AAC.1